VGQPFVGEIRMFAGNFAPAGWMFCNGALLPISENETLFNLIGTTYGGDGQETFALPNLSSRVPVHQGNFQGTPFLLGELSGTETVTLTLNQIPAHNHLPQAQSANGTQASPANGFWANSAVAAFAAATPDTAMNPAEIGPTGGSQPHDNMVPFLAVNFIISMFGIYPSQS